MAWKSTQTASNTIQATVEAMFKTGEEYRESIRDGREVYIDGERVKGTILGTTAAAVKRASPSYANA